MKQGEEGLPEEQERVADEGSIAILLIKDAPTPSGRTAA